MDPLSIFGYLGIFFVNAAYLPQVIKTIKLKKASQLSPPLFAMIFIGIIFYEIYAIWRGDPVFIISNLIGLIQPGLMIYLSIKWKEA